MEKCQICGEKAEHANRVNSIYQNNQFNEEILSNLSEFYKIMGDSTRLKLLIILANSPCNVSLLANTLNMTISAVSHQLRKLKDSKLVKANKNGKEVIYELDDDHVKLILDMAICHVNEN